MLIYMVGEGKLWALEGWRHAGIRKGVMVAGVR